jgi:hypothetical protein
MIVFISRYKEVGAEAKAAVTSTFHLLLDLSTFFDLYHSGKQEQAYKVSLPLLSALFFTHPLVCSQVIQDLNLLPFKLEEVDSKVKAFQNFSHEIRQNLPDVLLTTMNIIYSQYKTAKSVHDCFQIFVILLYLVQEQWCTESPHWTFKAARRRPTNGNLF